MLRPIDTQTIYQQTQEISNKQQAHQRGEEVQQTQFANIFHKETEVKNESVTQVHEDEHIDNNLEKKRGHGQDAEQKKYKKKKNDEKKKQEKNSSGHIDIRI